MSPIYLQVMAWCRNSTEETYMYVYVYTYTYMYVYTCIYHAQTSKACHVWNLVMSRVRMRHVLSHRKWVSSDEYGSLLDGCTWKETYIRWTGACHKWIYYSSTVNVCLVWGVGLFWMKMHRKRPTFDVLGPVTHDENASALSCVSLLRNVGLFWMNIHRKRRVFDGLGHVTHDSTASWIWVFFG